MTDNEIIKANKIIDDLYKYCYYSQLKIKKPCGITDNDFDFLHNFINSQKAEIERLEGYNENLQTANVALSNEILDIKSEAIKELCGKITEVFMRYAHLHPYAEGAREDFIEAVDGTEIEMQSVWDVFTLKKYEMSEYEEMNRLQENIETIATESLLTELEKDFRLLVKEMTDRSEEE